MNKNREKGTRLYEAIRKILIAVIIISGIFSEESGAAAVVLALSVLGLISMSIYSYSPSFGVKDRTKLFPSGSGTGTGMPHHRSSSVKLGGRMADKPIHCAHSRGKEKYFEQLHSFLNNGLIDRAEYWHLKERYSRLDIDDDNY